MIFSTLYCCCCPPGRINFPAPCWFRVIQSYFFIFAHLCYAAEVCDATKLIVVQAMTTK